jgi:hypothetical protein
LQFIAAIPQLSNPAGRVMADESSFFKIVLKLIATGVSVNTISCAGFLNCIMRFV